MKVSVIIPVYNVAAYLNRCVQSVVNQTYKATEIILVDDGSKDESPRLCDELAAQYANVQVIHKPNGGLSDARNAGLKAATGDYVVFLDGDDEWLIINGLEQMVAQLEQRPTDVLLFLRKDIYPATQTQSPDYTFDDQQDAQTIFRELILTERFNMSACFQLIRRRVLVDNELYFPLGMLSEDVPWSMRLWQTITTVSYCNIAMYGYYHRAGSITSSYTIRNMRCFDMYFTEAETAYAEGEFAEGAMNYYAGLWTNCAYNYSQLSAQERKEAREILKRHIGLLQYAQTPKALRAVKLKHLLGFRLTIIVLATWAAWRRRKQR